MAFLGAGAVCLVALFAISAGLPVHYKDCGSVQGKITSVDVSPCDNPDLCILTKRTNVTITINFSPSEAATAVKAVVHGILPSGIRAPFALHNPDGCKNSGLTCPLTSGAALSYHTQVYIYELYPPFRVLVQFELQDEAGKDLVCAYIPTKISSAEDANRTPKFSDDAIVA